MNLPPPLSPRARETLPSQPGLDAKAFRREDASHRRCLAGRSGRKPKNLSKSKLRRRILFASGVLVVFALTASPALAQSDFLVRKPEELLPLISPAAKAWHDASVRRMATKPSTHHSESSIKGVGFSSKPIWEWSEEDQTSITRLIVDSPTSGPPIICNFGEPPSPLPGSFPIAQERLADYTPITPAGRVRWVFKNTFGYRSLTLGIIYSGIQTARNKPEEWGPGWEGFGKRFGTRQATQLIGSSVEASVGALWGEDPRYFHSWRKGFWPRANYAAKMTFFSYRRDGSTGFAYARAIGISAGKAISSTWYPPTDNDWQDTMSRIGISYLGRFLANLWYEFTPEKWHGHK